MGEALAEIVQSVCFTYSRDGQTQQITVQYTEFIRRWENEVWEEVVRALHGDAARR